MSEMMECPVCGKSFPMEWAECLDNGNPACPECVQKERERMDEDL